MKVYRCLYEKEEIVLFKNGIISLTTHYNDYSDIKLNTHDYGEKDNGFTKKLKKERMHFFLFKEDAVEFMKNYICEDCFIAEYDIPDYLVIPNIGIGIYTLNENKIAMETAIPYGYILRDLNYEQYLTYYDLYKYNLLNVKYLSQRLDLEKTLNIDKIPLKIVKCNYPTKLTKTKNINARLNYELFYKGKEYKLILKHLGIKIIQNKEGRLIIQYINEPNLKEIRRILIKYKIIEKDKQKVKIK